MTEWIIRGIDALKTLAMKDAIRRAFARDGCFTAIRARAHENSLVAVSYEEDVAALLNGLEIDEAIEEIAADNGLVTDDFNEEAFEREEAAEDERLVLRL